MEKKKNSKQQITKPVEPHTLQEQRKMTTLIPNILAAWLISCNVYDSSFKVTKGKVEQAYKDLKTCHDDSDYAVKKLKKLDFNYFGKNNCYIMKDPKFKQFAVVRQDLRKLFKENPEKIILVFTGLAAHGQNKNGQ